ncbi:MAG: DUF1707 domain-containing protein [Actinomycetota bacterium]|nr:DUF1707 domain-containing protein [Actinomycetota bacterium]
MSSDDVRVSDLERDEVARRLRDHCAVGRLSFEELDLRLEDIYRAKTTRELARIVRDLPATSARSRQPRHRGWSWWPGVAAFHEERHLRASPESSYASALRDVVPRMALNGFHLVADVEPRLLRFASSRGLVVTVMLHPAVDGGTDVSSFGHAPRRVRRAFASLRD